MHDHRRSGQGVTGDLGPLRASVDRPGKRTLAEGLVEDGAAPVQRRAAGPAPDGSVHEAAERGVAGGGSALPHLDLIQRSFGAHDVSNIQAHTGDAAARASGELGAQAYATGNHVAFAGTPDLHTAAHEAAHVVQQRAGVQLKGGVGEAGDPYEQSADAVADRVVRGESAADLLPAGPSAAGTGVVQRQEAAPNLLTPGQAAMAVSFYRSQPDLYPPDVIEKIQRAVKSPETGVADAAMAQGVARFQEISVLKVDGMAGPRTLPRMFHSGLATKASRDQFVTTGKAVEADWAKLATPRARADKLFEGVKAQLDAEKVPTPAMDLGDLGAAAGVFAWKPWKITFDRAALSAPTIDDEEARSLSGTVYHEARHAEQHHKMARMLATRGHTAQQIQAKMGIPFEVADDAFHNKLPKGVEYATAAQQYDSVYGSGKAHFEKAEAEAPSLADLRAAQAAAAADPTPANKARAARLLAAYRAYHDLPTENDAFGTEADFGESWDEATAAGP